MNNKLDCGCSNPVNDCTHLENCRVMRLIEDSIYPAPPTATITDEKLKALRVAARAVIERWNTPLWKVAPATGIYIHALEKALDEVEGK